MTSNYSPALPMGYKDDYGVKEFIAGFFQTSDDQQQNEKWVNYYRENATFVFKGKTSHGREEIRKARSAMWDHVAERKHTIEKAVPARFQCPRGGDCLDLTIFGKLHQTLKNGETVTSDFVSHGRLKRESKNNNTWQIADYRIYGLV